MNKFSPLALAATVFLFSCGAEEKQAPLAAPASPSCNPAAKAAETSTRYLVQLNRPRGRSFRDAERSATRALASLTPSAEPERVAEGLLLVNGEAPLKKEEIEERLAPGSFSFVEPDYEVHALGRDEMHAVGTGASIAFGEAADPLLAKQWAHSTIHSTEAWAISRGSASVIVAVIDSGIDTEHPDLKPNLWVNPGEIPGNGLDDDDDGLVDDVNGWNFAANSNAILADDVPSYHGTHVSGTIGAAGGNGIGISGHAQEVRLMGLKFLKSTGSGNSSDAIRAIDYAINKGAKIISNSWGSRSYSKALELAIHRAEEAGVLFVVAAGNNGTSNDEQSFYPANYPGTNVISVAASTSADKLASFSNYGQKRVHLAAPGSNIYSTKNGGAYQTMSGTSMATPLVSGVLATMLAARPDLSFAQIRGALLSSVDQLPAYSGRMIWQGRVNAQAALSLVSSVPVGWEPPAPPEERPVPPPAKESCPR